jgi:hypothetical protein
LLKIIGTDSKSLIQVKRLVNQRSSSNIKVQIIGSNFVNNKAIHGLVLTESKKLCDYSKNPRPQLLDSKSISEISEVQSDSQSIVSSENEKNQQNLDPAQEDNLLLNNPTYLFNYQLIKKGVNNLLQNTEQKKNYQNALNSKINMYI